MHPSGDAATLDAILEPIAPSVRKWASLVVVDGEESSPSFRWYHYRDSEHAIDFWPASTIKIYTAVAALEYLNQLSVSSDSALIFERQVGDRWQVDAARTPREMISEVFRRSSNEDYTLLLRFVGIDRSTPISDSRERFPHSALMRDYVVHRPVVYENTEPQRIRIVGPDGKRRGHPHLDGPFLCQAARCHHLGDTTGNATSRASWLNACPHFLLKSSLRRKVSTHRSTTGLDSPRKTGWSAWRTSRQARMPGPMA